MTIEIKVFQTGRHYSEKGQRIAYLVTSDSIYFVDVDRGIDGVYDNPMHESFTAREVLNMYDNGGYNWFKPHDAYLRDMMRDKALTL